MTSVVNLARVDSAFRRHGIGTITEQAQAIGISREAWSRIRRGKAAPKWATIRKIAKAARVPVEHIAGDKQPA